MRPVLIVALLLAAAAPLAAEPLPPHKVVAVDDGESRRLVSVRLDRRVSEADLVHIATAAHKGVAEGKRMLVNFYLAGQKLTEASWASASFAPALKITIHGLSLEEEAAYRDEAARETRPVVGMWLTQAPAVPGLLTIAREKGKLYADWRVRGGHRTVEEVVETRGPQGRRFDITTDPTQHYVLIKGGELELREKTGLIAVAEPVKPEALSAKGAPAPVPPKPPAKSVAQTPQVIVPAAGPPPTPVAQAPAAPAVKSPFSPVLSAPAGAGFTITETVRETSAAAPAAPAAIAAAHATASVPAAPAEQHAAVPARPAAAKAGKESVKKKVAKAAHGAGAKMHTAAEPAKKPFRVEADVSVINKRIVN